MKRLSRNILNGGNLPKLRGRRLKMFLKTERAANDEIVQERPFEMLDELLEAHSIRGNGSGHKDGHFIVLRWDGEA